MLAMQVLRLMLDRFSGDGGADTSGSRGGRSGAGPRARGRGAGTMTSSLTFQQDARRYGHVCVCAICVSVCGCFKRWWRSLCRAYCCSSTYLVVLDDVTTGSSIQRPKTAA